MWRQRWPPPPSPPPPPPPPAAGPAAAALLPPHLARVQHSLRSKSNRRDTCHVTRVPTLRLRVCGSPVPSKKRVPSVYTAVLAVLELRFALHALQKCAGGSGGTRRRAEGHDSGGQSMLRGTLSRVGQCDTIENGYSTRSRMSAFRLRGDVLQRICDVALHQPGTRTPTGRTRTAPHCRRPPRCGWSSWRASRPRRSLVCTSQRPAGPRGKGSSALATTGSGMWHGVGNQTHSYA